MIRTVLSCTRALVLLCSAALVQVSASAFAPGGAWADKQVPQRDTRKPVPAANAAPAPEGTATLGGTVVADASGAPVRLAYVVLVGAGTGVLKVTSTDSAGKFSFAKLPADRYTVGASKLPYVGAVAGARRPARPGVPIVLANGATITDVAIRLPMGAAISGTVYDERGQPSAGAFVGLQQRKMLNGERVLVPAGFTAADDRGFYRAHSLVPGEYLVMALPQRPVSAGARALTDQEVDAALRGTPLPPAGAGPDQNMAFAPVYFPGTTRVNDAQAVLVAAGEDRQNVDLRLERVRMGRVEGTVATGDGQPLPMVTVFISTTPGSSPLTTTSTVRVGPPERRFGLTSAPGSYTLVARTPGTGGLFAVAQLDMAGSDVTGVQLILQPPLTFGGRLSAKGTTPLPALGGHRIQMLPISGALGGMAAPQVSATGSAGEFTVTNIVPGRYVIGSAPFLGASTASVTWGLESVVMDGKDVTDLPIDITAEALPKDVSVVLGDRWQELSGRLTDSAGAGVSDYTVLVFPVNDTYWLHGSRRIVTAQPGTDGRFTLGGPGPSLLPAGDYYLAAVTDVSKDEQYDPAFLQSLLGAAIRVTLAPGERQTQDLRVR